ncbi:hypothetical protein O3P69_004774 [Scylla paramamosain]|uniref:Secreted protein n=1 Tax=Scylla paramamosain TaxID=85552 RepID=A0AAW0UF32_SCYPA
MVKWEDGGGSFTQTPFRLCCVHVVLCLLVEAAAENLSGSLPLWKPSHRQRTASSVRGIGSSIETSTK